jgi:hypothetical protein
MDAIMRHFRPSGKKKEEGPADFLKGSIMTYGNHLLTFSKSRRMHYSLTTYPHLQNKVTIARRNLSLSAACGSLSVATRLWTAGSPHRSLKANTVHLIILMHLSKSIRSLQMTPLDRS